MSIYMPLARTRTHVGKVPRARSTRRGSALVKTSRRGAYNKKRKNNFQRRRVPFVETKTCDDRDLASTFPLSLDTRGIVYRNYVTGLLHMNPDSFLLKQQGLGESQMLGQSLYARFLKMKISIQFPSPNSIKTDDGSTKQLPLHPQRYELVWGFIPSPFGWTDSTEIDARLATKDDIHDYINKRVDEYFDSLTDTMDFIPKRASAIRIVGRRNIKPSLRQISAPAQYVGGDITSATQVGTRATYDTSISWPMKRKVHYVKTSNLDGDSKETAMYANWSWLPFAVLRNHDYDAIPATSRAFQTPALMWNSQLWYQDS